MNEYWILVWRTYRFWYSVCSPLHYLTYAIWFLSSFAPLANLISSYSAFYLSQDSRLPAEPRRCLPLLSTAV